MRVVVCEENTQDKDVLFSFCEQYARDAGVVMETAHNHHFGVPEAEEADVLVLETMVQGEPKGIETARELRSRGFTGVIIFITHHRDFFEEGFEVGAVHYLIKPVEFEDFSTAMDRAVFVMGEPERTVDLPIGRRTVTVPESRILYVDVYGRETYVHLDQETFRVTLPLKDIQDLLSGDNFLRCFRSCIVNMAYIEAMGKEHIKLENGERLRISLRNSGSLGERFLNFKVNRRRRN